MKILIVSGFLGAGKTTFIKHLARRSGRPFVVLENEYGQQGVDGTDLKAQKIDVVELSEGCVCCSMKGNFLNSVITLQGAMNPELLVVEPSGIGLLSNILANLAPLERAGIITLAPLTLVDCSAAPDEELAPYLNDAVVNGETLILTKIDALDEGAKNLIAADLRQRNAEAEIITDDYRNLPAEWFAGLLDRPRGEKKPTLAALPETKLDQITLSPLTLDDFDRCIALLEGTLRGAFGKVARLKGFANLNGQWGHFDVAGGRWGIEPCDPAPPSRCIVIGKDLNEQALRQAWQN